VLCALATAETCLAELDPRAQRAGMTDETRRILGLLRTNLEFHRLDDLLEDLPGQLRAVQSGCEAANAALATRYFRQTTSIEWILEGAGQSEETSDAAAS
jgi:uncharacterized alpha-E superfamily protein